MKKAAIFLLMIIAGCNMSDAIEQLGDGYELNIEGHGNNRIFHNGGDGKGIRHDVIAYDYSVDYIVAKQKPAEFDDAIDDDDIIIYPD